MIFLNTSQSLQIVLSGNVNSSQLQFTCSYIDLSPSYFTGAVTDGTTNNTAPVTIAPSPANASQRQLKFLSVYNTDTTTQIVTVQYFDGINTNNIFTAYLGVGWVLIYNNDKGFEIYNQYGMKASDENLGVPYTFTLSCADGIFQAEENSQYVFGTRYGVEPEYVSSFYLPSFLLPSSLLGNYFGFYLPASCTITGISLSAGYLNSAGSCPVSVYFIKNNTSSYLIDSNVDFSIINYKSNNPVNVQCGEGDYITAYVDFGANTPPTGFFITLLFYCN